MKAPSRVQGSRINGIQRINSNGSGCKGQWVISVYHLLHSSRSTWTNTNNLDHPSSFQGGRAQPLTRGSQRMAAMSSEDIPPPSWLFFYSTSEPDPHGYLTTGTPCVWRFRVRSPVLVHHRSPVFHVGSAEPRGVTMNLKRTEFGPRI